MDEFGLNKDDPIVDSHGREIPTIFVGPRNEQVCLLSDLKQTGVGIFQRSQFAKLPKIQKDFGPDFMEHMLESAKSYMLANKISFTEDQIINSIQYCKCCLEKTTISTSQTPKQNSFIDSKTTPQTLRQSVFRDRTVESSSVTDIKIQVANINLNTSPSPQSFSHPDASHSIKPKNFPKKGFSNHNNKNPRDDQSFDTSGSEKGGPKLRPPKQNFYNVESKEHNVIVTSIDKMKCIWVRDLANENLLKEIQDKVNIEARFQNVPRKPWVMDKVYMAKEQNDWFRCKIVRFSPLIVLFLDYGTIAEVEEIREVSQEISKHPNLAVRITFKERHYNPQLEDVLRIKKFMKNADGTLFVNILPKSQNPTTPLVEKNRSEENLKIVQKSPRSPSPTSQSFGDDDDSWGNSSDESSTPVVKKALEFFKKPAYLQKLENDARVAICYFRNDIFYLRTKSCFDKLREIESSINDYVTRAESLRQAKNDQIVLYQDEKDGKFYRAQVKKVGNYEIDVEFLDYVKCERGKLTRLKTISERLSQEPIANIPGGRLAGFRDKQLNKRQIGLIEEYIKTRKKFTVVLDFDDDIDLRDEGKSLSDEILSLEDRSKKRYESKKSENFEKEKGKIFLREIKTYKPEIGISSYVCGSYRGSQQLTLVPSEEFEQNADFVLRYDLEDKTPYIPTVGEVCMCFYVDTWYRCTVTRIFSKEYEVLLLDFGNIELIKKEDLRKPEENIADVPALAVPCVLVGLPTHSSVEDHLKKLIIDGEIYNVDVKKIQDGKYQVEIPTVYKKIKFEM